MNITNHLGAYSLDEGSLSIANRSIFSSLTSSQKQWIVISCIAAAILSIGYIAYRIIFRSNQTPPPPPSPQTGTTHAPKNPSLLPKLKIDPTFGDPDPLAGLSPMIPSITPKIPSISPKIPPISPKTMSPFNSPQLKKTLPGFGGNQTISPVGLGIDPFGIKNPVISPSTKLPKLKNPDDGDGDAFGTLVKKIQGQTLLIQEEEQTLQIMEESAGGEENDSIKQKKKEIDQLKKDLDKNYNNSLASFNDYMTDHFTGLSKKNQIFHQHIIEFHELMKNQKGNEKYIFQALNMINSFIKQKFFSNPKTMCINEKQKKEVMIFCQFFPIINEFIPTIQKDVGLLNSLKIIFANLPLREDRSIYPHLFLSEANQRDLLIAHFIQEENQALTKLDLNEEYSEDDREIIVKLGMKTSPLQPQNLIEFRKKIERQTKKTIGWDVSRKEEILSELQSTLNTSAWSKSEALSNLKFASSAKKIFVSQKHLPSAGPIPRWYHSTRFKFLKNILDQGEIDVNHKQAYKGSWVSTETEWQFGGGESVLVFNHSICELDKNAFIGYENTGKIWRGLQNPIALKNEKGGKPHLAYIGLRVSSYMAGNFREQRKEIQNKIALQFPKAIYPVKVYTQEFVDYIQKHFWKVLGNPNLTEKWWGKESIDDLDKIYTH